MNDLFLVERSQDRRRVLALGASAVVTGLFPHASLANNDADSTAHIATNTYPWFTFARRNKQRFKLHTDELLADVAKTGINGYEPIIEKPEEITVLKKRLNVHELEMRSIYVNSVLHDENKVEGSIASVLAIAKAAYELGTRIVVTNPSPIRWGGNEDKSDSQLQLQGKALDQLGAELKKIGITLAYHNHDAELRQGGREFHHMLTATRPENVRFCLDAHWVFRGCGNSEVALFDAVAHYHERIVELHLRQSTNGIWDETFSMTGDINYKRLFDFLAGKNITPHLVLEQAVEAKSPRKFSVTEAHRTSYENLRKAV